MGYVRFLSEYGGIFMQLSGYMKLTLQDYPEHVAAMCFMRGCQLRCPYCHNAEIVLSGEQGGDTEGEDKTSEFLSYLEQRKHLLDGVVVSGGEPLLQKDIQDFLHIIKEKGLKVKLDTNGLMPDRLKELINDKLLDYIALDFKNCRENYPETVGLSRPKDPIITENYYNSWRTSLHYLRESKVPYEIRTTVVRELHPHEALLRMTESICHESGARERWFIQSFERSGSIMRDYTNQEINLTAYSKEEMEGIRQELSVLAPGVQLRG